VEERRSYSLKKKSIDIDKIAKICSDCGNCLYSCPVYNAELIEPNSPRGKINLIKAILDGRLKPNKLNKEFMSQCLLCGSCEYICTNGVEYLDMMIKYRNLIFKERKIPFEKKTILYFYQTFVLKKLAWFFKILSKTPLKNKLTIPGIDNINLNKLYTSDYSKDFDILLFPGCVLTYFYSSQIGKIKKFLENKGFKVALPKYLKCCGFPYISQGWKKMFDKLKTKNINIFSDIKFKYLVVPCGTGVITFKKYYDLNGVEVYELTEFIYKFIKDLKINLNILEEEHRKVTYHDPCHNLKSLGIYKEPRKFMKQFGKRFVDDKSELCCGFGGIFSVGFPNTSKKILDKREKYLKETGADIVFTSCPGCYMQLRENLPYDVRFFIELFD